MKTIINEQGSALITTLFVIVVAAAIVGTALNFTQGTVKQTDASRDFSNLRFESEGALEAAYGMWLKTANNKYGAPNSDDIDSSVRGPAPASSTSPFNFPYATGGQLKIDMLDEYGAPLPTTTATTPSPVYVSLDKYPGWKGVKFSYAASVKLASSSAPSAKTYGLKRTIDYVSVPLFQAMGFFEDNVELYKPADMIIAGLVHTNHNAFLSTANTGKLVFQNNVSYVNGYATNDINNLPIGANAWSASTASTIFPPTYSNGGESSQVSQVSRLEPLGTDPGSVIDATDSNPNNDSMRELIEPPVAGYTDPDALAGRRLYNKAGIVVKIDSVTTTTTTTTGSGKKAVTTTTTTVTPTFTVTTKNGVSLTSTQQTAITNALSQATITDKREGKTVDVTTLDVGAVKSSLQAATGFSTNGTLYIYDASSTGQNDPKAVRLKNGGSLPSSGLTVVSENPIYIQGDYNTGSTASTLNSVPSNNGGNASNNKSSVVSGYTKVPSAVISDAITILSNSWNDANSASALSGRPAANTTVNTAIVTGSIPSGWTNNGTIPAYGYSGGFNNFPRFLESWSGDSFTYFGSMVQLFTSKTFTGEWDTGDIYAPPVRAWNFDSSFLATPPPGSLDVVSRERGELVRY